MAITGSSGYLGRSLIACCRQRDPSLKILGLDVATPGECAPDEFVRADIRSPEVSRALSRFRPDTVVHLAFVVNPIVNERIMREINLGGTQNLLQAVKQLCPQRLLMASSATAFGAWPDNPIPIYDDGPLRARREFGYARDKTELEHVIRDFAHAEKHIRVSWIRPTVICGPNVDNYLSRLLLHSPWIVLLDGQDVPLQFVHENDVVAATYEILSRGAAGGFNIAPPDCVLLSEISAMLSKRTLRLPFWLVRFAAAVWWRLRLHRVFGRFEYPPGFLYFLRHPWVIESDRLRSELGFEFQHSSRQTLEELVRAHRRERMEEPLTADLPAPITGDAARLAEEESVEAVS